MRSYSDIKLYISDCSIVALSVRGAIQSKESLCVHTFIGTTDYSKEHCNTDPDLTIIERFYSYRLPGVGSRSCRNMASAYVGAGASQ
jgi:hypothetical protein